MLTGFLCSQTLQNEADRETLFDLRRWGACEHIKVKRQKSKRKCRQNIDKDFCRVFPTTQVHVSLFGIATPRTELDGFDQIFHMALSWLYSSIYDNGVHTPVSNTMEYLPTYVLKFQSTSRCAYEPTNLWKCWSSSVHSCPFTSSHSRSSIVFDSYDNGCVHFVLVFSNGHWTFTVPFYTQNLKHSPHLYHDGLQMLYQTVMPIMDAYTCFIHTVSDEGNPC